MIKGPGGEAARQSKHTAMQGAIERLEGAISKFEDLANEISGEKQEQPTVDTKPPQQSLSEFLDGGEDKIESLKNRLSEVQDGIRAKLF